MHVSKVTINYVAKYHTVDVIPLVNQLKLIRSQSNDSYKHYAYIWVCV